MKPSNDKLDLKRRGRDRAWFDRGGRHGLDNRVSDFKLWITASDKIATAVDIGAAEGEISNWLSNYVENMHAIEYFEGLFDSLNNNSKHFGTFTCEKADILNSPLNKQYDIVFLLGVLHYFDKQEQRAQVIKHCLEHSKHSFITRTGILEFKMKNPDFVPKPKHISIFELCDFDNLEFNIYVNNNNYRNEENRLGDLIIFYRKSDNNPLPNPSDLIDGLMPLSTAIDFCK